MTYRNTKKPESVGQACTFLRYGPFFTQEMICLATAPLFLQEIACEEW